MEGEIKIVTYNVNGLRPRVSQFGSLLKLLNALEADIICMQETKLSRQDLSADIAMAEGYESFFSCTRTLGKGRVRYSGVATFCRVNSAFSSNEVALPLEAEEGFSGLLEQSRNGDVMLRDCPLNMPLEVDGLEKITTKDLLEVDSEGRCIITDHGHFVLFNLYGPRAGSDDMERLHFKLKYFKILQKRWESLLNLGKRVIVVGDLNIAPAAIDSCNAGPDFEDNVFRKWLRSLLTECGGPFLDAFRAKHPSRKEAYTCWPQQTGGEEFNYGSRIDHILIAGPCLHQNHDGKGHSFSNCHMKVCDIRDEFKRWKPGTFPRWDGGRSIKLEGSDHVPVYICLTEIPNLPLHNTPSLAARYVPEIRGLQQTIASLLLRRKEVVPASQIPVDKTVPTSNMEAHSMKSSIKKYLVNVVDKTQVSNWDTTESMSQYNMANKKKVRHGNSSQLTLRSFYQKENRSSSADGVTCNIDCSSSQYNLSRGNFDTSNVTGGSYAPDETVTDYSEEISQKNEVSKIPLGQDQRATKSCCSYEKEKISVSLEWQRIQQLMQNSIPLCKGHREPCVSRSVKKGQNIGRGFYVCARPEGPASNPEANCGHFQWSSSKSKKRKR